MLKNNNGQQANADSINKMKQFLDDFSCGIKKQGASPDDIDDNEAGQVYVREAGK